MQRFARLILFIIAFNLALAGGPWTPKKDSGSLNLNISPLVYARISGGHGIGGFSLNRWMTVGVYRNW